ncbi:hypothetical protein DFJ74DRAFT_743155 [Hyaloraphidium curvatum]|nr:hypothetical protein DFJ74DRAFT_743155 [Hyaloraphidium curvatum]
MAEHFARPADRAEGAAGAADGPGSPASFGSFQSEGGDGLSPLSAARALQRRMYYAKRSASEGGPGGTLGRRRSPGGAREQPASPADDDPRSRSRSLSPASGGSQHGAEALGFSWVEGEDGRRDEADGAEGGAPDPPPRMASLHAPGHAPGHADPLSLHRTASAPAPGPPAPPSLYLADGYFPASPATPSSTPSSASPATYEPPDDDPAPKPERKLLLHSLMSSLSIPVPRKGDDDPSPTSAGKPAGWIGNLLRRRSRDVAPASEVRIAGPTFVKGAAVDAPPPRTASADLQQPGALLQPPLHASRASSAPSLSDLAEADAEPGIEPPAPLRTASKGTLPRATTDLHLPPPLAPSPASPAPRHASLPRPSPSPSPVSAARELRFPAPVVPEAPPARGDSHFSTAPTDVLFPPAPPVLRRGPTFPEILERIDGVDAGSPSPAADPGDEEDGEKGGARAVREAAAGGRRVGGAEGQRRSVAGVLAWEGEGTSLQCSGIKADGGRCTRTAYTAKYNNGAYYCGTHANQAEDKGLYKVGGGSGKAGGATNYYVVEQKSKTCGYGVKHFGRCGEDFKVTSYEGTPMCYRCHDTQSLLGFDRKRCNRPPAQVSSGGYIPYCTEHARSNGY